MAETRNSLVSAAFSVSSDAGHSSLGGHTPSSAGSHTNPGTGHTALLRTNEHRASEGSQLFQVLSCPLPLARKTDPRKALAECLKLTNVGFLLSVSTCVRVGGGGHSAWVPAVKVRGVKCHRQVFLLYLRTHP